MGKASGPVGFLEIYDATFWGIAQGGSRRGANMGVLRVDHPDIEEFIVCKTDEGKVRGFNISVALTDEFMQAVEEDESFTLCFDGESYDHVPAVDLFDKITEAAWKNGEPGSLFIDRANETSHCSPHGLVASSS